jgi:16S rRNA (guanine527-N7)-methyltransferase
VSVELADVPAAVLAVLADGQSEGFIGPGSLAPHVRHAIGFLEVLVEARGSEPSSADRIADLGPGAGLPGLVLASVLPRTAFTFVEGSTRKAAFLRSAVESCELGDRVEVVGQRAEVAARQERLRGQHSVVVARAFGTPSETAECGAPLLRPGGLLIVSEPPPSDDRGRWPAEGLALLGLRAISHPYGYALFQAAEACPEAYPRRVGVPRKRPLF